MERERLYQAVYQAQENKPKKPKRVIVAEWSRKGDIIQTPLGGALGFAAAGPVGALIGAGIPIIQFLGTGVLKRKWERDEAKKAAGQAAMVQEAQQSRGLLRVLDPLKNRLSTQNRQPRPMAQAA